MFKKEKRKDLYFWNAVCFSICSASEVLLRRQSEFLAKITMPHINHHYFSSVLCFNPGSHYDLL